MIAAEVALCTFAMVSSSISQLFIKAASISPSLVRGTIQFGMGAALQICSVLLAVVVLRTMNLSQLVAFAAFAYVLVPIGSHMVFGERLRLRFWGGSLLIVAGIVIASS